MRPATARFGIANLTESPAPSLEHERLSRVVAEVADEKPPSRQIIMNRTARLILVVVLLILLLGLLPAWPYSAGWGYFPSGGVGVLLLIVIILLLMDRI